jgi:putative addiction module component (TIGR02574 family)
LRIEKKSAIHKPMPIIDEIVEKTRDLPADVVADLVDRILLARFGTPSELSPEWKREIARRVKEIEEGRVQGIPWEVVQEKVRALGKA